MTNDEQVSLYLKIEPSMVTLSPGWDPDWIDSRVRRDDWSAEMSVYDPRSNKVTKYELRGKMEGTATVRDACLYDVEWAREMAAARKRDRERRISGWWRRPL